eukprot:Hpha_TRINITY_DN16089_c5_g4::TRINITY_DN16089_c5_g4_i1::g.119500::m.119500
MRYNADVGAMQSSAELEKADGVWKVMVDAKRSNELVYKALGFSCNSIVWNFDKTSAVALGSGALYITSATSAKNEIFPKSETGAFTNTLAALKAKFGAKGFAAYAVQTEFTANIGC